MGSLFHITTWERVSTGRRILGALARATTLIVLLLALAYLCYRYRYPLTAKLWHWKHGYSTTMGNYEVPVPVHWLITDQNYGAFTLMNTAPNVPGDAKFHTTAVVTVTPYQQRAIGPEGLAAWLSLQRRLLVRQDVKSVEEKTLKFGNESITCIGGPQLAAILRSIPNQFETDIVSLDCMSERGLGIAFVGEPSDLQPFYTFVSQIRRKQ
jgi:hypothetical protein